MPKIVPYYQRYPRDYATSDVAFLSLQAQGLWLRLEDLMHLSDRYGYLAVAGKPMPDIMAARRCGVSLDEFKTVLQELEDAGVAPRERHTKILYSPTLLHQEEVRAGNRDRKKTERENKNSDQTSLNLDENFDKTPGKLAENSPKTFEDDTRKVLTGNNNGHSAVPPYARAYAANANASASDPASAFAFDLPLAKDNPCGITGISEVPPWNDSTPYTPPTLDELVTAAAEALPAVVPRGALGRAAGSAGEANGAAWDASALVEEIALASPTALALRWTAMSIHGKSQVTYPVLEAVLLESREQGITEREAALWLLARMRSVTEAVQREAGWERYWPPGRLARFLRGTEYRNTAQFEVTTPREGGSNGNGRSGRAERNAEAVRRALGGTRAPTVDRQQPAVASERVGRGAERAGGHPGSRSDAAGDGQGLRGGAGAAKPPGGGHSVQPGARDLPVHAATVRASRLGWPA